MFKYVHFLIDPQVFYFSFILKLFLKSWIKHSSCTGSGNPNIIVIYLLLFLNHCGNSVFIIYSLDGRIFVSLEMRLCIELIILSCWSNTLRGQETTLSICSSMPSVHWETTVLKRSQWVNLLFCHLFLPFTVIFFLLRRFIRMNAVDAWAK